MFAGVNLSPVIDTRRPEIKKKEKESLAPSACTLNEAQSNLRRKPKRPLGVAAGPYSNIHTSSRKTQGMLRVKACRAFIVAVALEPRN